jgi:hypothetical protein
VRAAAGQKGKYKIKSPRCEPSTRGTRLSRFDVSAEVQKLKFTNRVDELVLVYGQGYVPWKELGKDPTVSLWLDVGVLDMHSGTLVLFYYCEGQPKLNNLDLAVELPRKNLRRLTCPVHTKPTAPDDH